MSHTEPHMTIELVPLLPVCCGGVPPAIDVPTGDIEEMKTSLCRQLDDVVRMWAKESDGMVVVNAQLQVTHRPIEEMVGRTIEKPPVTDLVGQKLARKAWCFAVWLPYPDAVQARSSPNMGHDYLWIPTSVEKEQRDLKRTDVRPALNEELQHWVQNRMRIDLCTGDFPSATDADYWERLKQILIRPGFVQKFLDMMRKRIAVRNKGAGIE